MGRRTRIIHVLGIQIGICILLLILIAPVIDYRHNIVIAYHRHRALNAVKTMEQINMEKAQGKSKNKDLGRYSAQLTKHTDTLKDLGFLIDRSFSVTCLTMRSPQIQDMRNDYCLRYTKQSDSQLCSFYIHEGSLVVTDQPDRMNTWEMLVSKYDVMLADPCQPNNPRDSLVAPLPKSP